MIRLKIWVKRYKSIRLLFNIGTRRECGVISIRRRFSKDSWVIRSSWILGVNKVEINSVGLDYKILLFILFIIHSLLLYIFLLCLIVIFKTVYRILNNQSIILW